jgi:uncharacterized protein (DUF302 family)
MLYSREATGGFDETVDRLSQAVTDHHFGVIEAIDLKGKLNGKGVEFERGCTVLEVCNPHRAKVALDEDMSLATALPCRIAVYEQGGGVVVAMIRPSVLLGLFVQGEEVSAMASEVEQDLVAVIDQACDAGGA